MENTIEIKNISKHYQNFSLNDINLTVPKGSIVGLIGENGAGKTTTIKMLLNLINRESGEINIFGLDNITHEKQIKTDIGVVMDDSFLSDFLNAKDINKIMKAFYTTWDENLYYDYLKEFNLSETKVIKDFSSGMKMKLKIITALAHRPKLLILDEPTSGLDPIARNEILDIFRDFVEDEEHSILLSSHITSDLEHITDYISFIHEGSIVMSEATDTLMEDYGIVKCTKEEFTTIDKNDYIKYRQNKYDYEVLIKDKQDFKNKYSIKAIDKPSIENIMVLYIKGEK